MDKITHVLLWIFVGAIVVLIVKNASGFSTAVTAVGGQVTGDASLLAGYGPSGQTQSSSVGTAAAFKPV